MKKLTPNQADYLKQIRRIRSNLSRLRKQGFDVSDLANKYTTDLPKRVTRSMLDELQSITARKIRKELTNNFIGIAPTYITPEGKRTVTPLATNPLSYKYSHETAPIGKDKGYSVPTTFTEEVTLKVPSPDNLYGPKRDFTISPITMADFMPEPSVEETPIDDIMPHPTETIVDEANNRILTIDTETGEILNEQPINPTPEEPEPPTPYEDEYEDEYEEYDYEDALKDWYEENHLPEYSSIQNEEIPDLSDMVIMELKDLISGYIPEIEKILYDALDEMINAKGQKAFYDAFMDSTDDHPNLVEELSNSKYERYKGNVMAEFLGELAEKLDLDMNIKQQIRNAITNNSMSDIEDYV